MIDNKGKNLVFLFSLPRSGSTLLSLMLGNHSKVSCPPEPWFLLKLAHMNGYCNTSSLFDDELATESTRDFLKANGFIEAARAFAAAAYNQRLQGAGKSIFLDKTPRYYHILGFIDQLFPKAKKIWLKRNLLDMALSYKTSWKIGIDEISGQNVTFYTYDFTVGPYELAAYFQKRDAGKYELKYEDLVSSPREQMADLCAFLGIPYEEAMLNYLKDTGLVSQHKASMYGDKKIFTTSSVHTDSLGKWKSGFTPEEVEQLVGTIGMDIFRQMGYDNAIDELTPFIKKDVSEKACLERRNTINSVKHDKLTAMQLRLELSEADRTARIDVIHKLEERLRESDTDRTVRLDVIHKLEEKLRESDTDRTVRLDVIHKLEEKLRESDTDRTVRLDVIHKLEEKLRESDTDRTARIDVIHKLEERLRESDTDRTARLDVIHKLEEKLRESDTDRTARLDVIHKLEEQLRVSELVQAELTEIKTSRSWKLTAPLRRLHKLFSF